MCDCDESGTVDGVCDSILGKCLCKPGYTGERCSECDMNFYGYPKCKECNCNQIGSKTTDCNRKTGECPCK